MPITAFAEAYADENYRTLTLQPQESSKEITLHATLVTRQAALLRRSVLVVRAPEERLILHAAKFRYRLASVFADSIPGIA